MIEKFKTIKTARELTKEQRNEIVQLTPFLDKNTSISQRFWHISNSYLEEKKCSVCSNLTTWNSIKSCYNKYCSEECKNKGVAESVVKTNLEKYGVRSTLITEESKIKSKNTNLKKYGVSHHTKTDSYHIKRKKIMIEKYGVDHHMKIKSVQNTIKETNLERYGVGNPFQSDEIKNKIKKTNLQRYGVENPFQSDEIKNKIKKTNLQRYGVENPFQSDEIKNKIKETNLKKYGKEHIFQSEEIKNKIYETNIDRYGFKSPIQNPEIKNKIYETNIDRYGFKSPIQNPEIKNKIYETNIDRYGFSSPAKSQQVKNKTLHTNNFRYQVNHPTQQHYSDETYNILLHENLFRQFVKDKPLTQISTELQVDKKTVASYLIKYECYDLISRNTKPEYLFKEFLDSHGIKYLINTRKVIPPYELDFFLPDYDIGIEINGLFWHSEVKKDKMYHYNKYKMCRNNNIKLFQLYDSEILDNNSFSKWSNYLSYKLNINCVARVGARQCSICHIDNNLFVNFLNKVHIQNSSKSSIRLGAYYNGSLVSTIGLSKHKNDFLIDRFAALTISPGLFSKFVKYIRKNYIFDNIITFSDNRYSWGELYERSGFAAIKELTPDYYYTDFHNFYHKFGFRKQILKNKFNIDITNKTERQITKELGYYKIWDAGKIKWCYND